MEKKKELKTAVALGFDTVSVDAPYLIYAVNVTLE